MMMTSWTSVSEVMDVLRLAVAGWIRPGGARGCPAGQEPSRGPWSRTDPRRRLFLRGTDLDPVDLQAQVAVVDPPVEPVAHPPYDERRRAALVAHQGARSR